MKPRKGFTPVAGMGSLRPVDAIVLLLKRKEEQVSGGSPPADRKLTRHRAWMTIDNKRSKWVGFQGNDNGTDTVVVGIRSGLHSQTRSVPPGKIVIMWAYLLQGIGYGFAAAVQPGPFQTYVISQTLRNGWRQTLPAALAPLISDGPILILTLIVLSHVPAWFERFLYIAGGLFILYLAYSAFTAWRNFDEARIVIGSEGRQSAVRAAMMNALSPGPYLYWSLVTGPILLTGWRLAPANGVGFLASFYATMVLSLGTIIAVFGTARQLGAKVNRMLVGVSAIALAGFGMYQLWLGLTSGRAG